MPSQTTKLQIPIAVDLKEMLKKRIHQLGFTSLNEAIRFVLNQFAIGKFTVTVSEEHEYIGELDEETEKRIGESLRDYERGDYIVVDPSKGKDEIKKALNSML